MPQDVTAGIQAARAKPHYRNNEAEIMGIQMDTHDQAIVYGTLTNPNPYEKDAKEHSQDAIESATEDMLDKLLGNGRRLTDCIFDGDDHSLNCSEVHYLGSILSALLTCNIDDRIDHLDGLRNLFKRPLHDETEKMAIAYLDAQEDDE